MCEVRLTEIQQRVSAATPGPWGGAGLPYDGYARGDPVIRSADGRYVAQTVYDGQGESLDHNIDADTLFIAHARQDVPDLIAAYEAERAKREAAEAEVARLKALLARVM